MKLTTLLFLLIGFFFTNHSSAQTFDELMQKAETIRFNSDSDEVIQLYNKAIKLNGKSAEAYYWRGMVKSETNLNKGIDDILKSIELDPFYERPYHQASLFYSVTGDYEKAERFERKAIALNPLSANNQLLLARIVRESGDLKRSLILCDSSIRQHDESIEWLATIERAEVRFELNDYTGAIEDFSKCFNDFGYGMYSSSQYEQCGDAYHAIAKISLACEYWTMATQNLEFEEVQSETAVEKLAKYCK